MFNHVRFICHSLRKHPEEWEPSGERTLKHTPSEVEIDANSIHYGDITYPLHNFKLLEKMRINRLLRNWICNKVRKVNHDKKD